MSEFEAQVISSMRQALTKDAGLREALGNSKVKAFIEGAKHEVGPALGATIGAGTAKALGIDPLAGAGAGYGLGSVPDIVHAIRQKRLGAKLTPG